MNSVLLHINYFEQGQTVERACELASKLRADGIEFRRQPAGYSGSDLDYLDDVSRALDKYPLNCVSFGGPGINLMSPDSGVRERELDAAEAFYRKAASQFPLTVVNTFTGNLPNPDKTLPYVEYWHHGSAIATDEQWRNAISGFQRMGTIAGELGFRFAFETHGCYLHDTVDATMRLVNGVGSDHVGLLWDQANLMIFPEQIGFDEVISKAGAKLFYVHLKNLLVPPSQLLAVSSLGGGILNIREQLGKLLASGYADSLCIESPRGGDREYFALEDIEYLRSVLSDFRRENRK